MVGTPIGNLEDITLRALRVLREVSLIAAEDTRTARRLLTHYEIQTPVTSYFEHNELAKLDLILGALQKGDVALISEAGMPGLSDPGYRLIAAAIEAGISVVPIPGPSALTAALVVSGLPTDSFVYLGFLPRQRSARRSLLATCQSERRTLVAFEAPHRLVESLRDILAILGNRPVAVARELTKLFEEVRRGQIGEMITHFVAEPPRGEITLVIGGAVEAQGEPWTEERIRQELAALLSEGLSKSEAARIISAACRSQSVQWPRRKIYRLAMNLADELQMEQGEEGIES